MLNEKRRTLNMILLIQGLVHTIKQIRLEARVYTNSVSTLLTQ